MTSTNHLAVSIRRGQGERYDEFEVERRESQTVLDVVTEIQRQQDASLSYRFACRVGMCGSCAMTVNGRPRWTCRTRVSQAVDRKGGCVLEPLRNLPVIKDLAVEMTPFFEKWRDAKGFFEPGGAAASGFRQGAALLARAPGGGRRHRMHQLRHLLFGLRRRRLATRLSRPRRAQSRLDPAQ